jgi:integrase
MVLQRWLKPTEFMCPIETVRAVLQCDELSRLRRVTTHVYALSGMRPGELHGLLISDVKTEQC